MRPRLRTATARRLCAVAASACRFCPLTADERDWFLAFSDAAHVVRMSEGVIEGDTVRVTRGPLMGREGLIRKIDRHKRRAYLEVTMFGRTVPASVGLEIVRKTA